MFFLRDIPDTIRPMENMIPTINTIIWSLICLPLSKAVEFILAIMKPIIGNPAPTKIITIELA